jgi:hypothetical protein
VFKDDAANIGLVLPEASAVILRPKILCSRVLAVIVGVRTGPAARSGRCCGTTAVRGAAPQPGRRLGVARVPANCGAPPAIPAGSHPVFLALTPLLAWLCHFWPGPHESCTPRGRTPPPTLTTGSGEWQIETSPLPLRSS